MNKIILGRVEEPVTKLFGPDNKLVGYIKSAVELDDVRLQIKKAGLTNYYVKFNKQVIRINSEGVLECWPKGFYDQHETIISKLIGWID